MRIGIDLGGTKIEAVGLDAAGAVRERRRIPTPRESYSSIVEAVADLVAEIEQRSAERGTVGVGIPGVVSPATGLVKNANLTILNGHPLDRDLRAALHREVRVANDANCFALSEAVDGAASGCDVVFGVILGTGTGGGIVVGGRALFGRDGIAGEWGHNPLPWPSAEESPGPACWCKKHGCLETYLSGPGLARDYARVTGSELGATEIATRAEAGDRAARATLARYEHRLARGLASIVNVLNPDVVVLGGGVSNIERLYQNVPALWSEYVFSDRVSTRLVPALHGDSSGVRGAAWLWNEQSQNRRRPVEIVNHSPEIWVRS